MSGKRYTYAFKIEEVKQVTERGSFGGGCGAAAGHHDPQPFRLETEVRQARRFAEGGAGSERRGSATEGRAQAHDRGARHSKKSRGGFNRSLQHL